MQHTKLVIFVRLPEAGKVKTRLVPAVGEDAAARIYARLVEHTLAVARTSRLPIELRVTGGSASQFRDWLGQGFEITEQGEGDLGDRLARIEGPALVIGSDCPGISAPILRDAASALDDHAVVLGPATDGGYYLIGFRERMPYLFSEMAWSTSVVFAKTIDRLASRGIGPAILPELSDIDTPEDLGDWPDLQ